MGNVSGSKHKEQVMRHPDIFFSLRHGWNIIRQSIHWFFSRFTPLRSAFSFFSALFLFPCIALNARSAPRLHTPLFYFFLFTFSFSTTSAQTSPYPDQQFVISSADSLLVDAELIENIASTSNGMGIQLSDSALTGTVVLRVQSSPYPFDRGLPSWNGTAPGNSGSFRVFMRFPYGSGWSPWMEVGFWKANLWPGDKSVIYGGGRIDIDTVVLYSFVTQWQFKIEMKRTSETVNSPTLSLLSFFASDDRTTDQLDYTDILADAPAQIIIPTTFLAQSQISDEYGSRICSPTTVSMILLSYLIDVDPLEFALDTYDPYYHIFGVWPRVVQNASELGLRGTVTRYRTWSETREVLANGGRIGMSIGYPLYTGHLVMLAGFNASGEPLVHDPARTYDGYAYHFNKSQLSHAWFDKGGVAYTFYLRDSSAVTSVPRIPRNSAGALQSFRLFPNYPNPFNSSTSIAYQLPEHSFVELGIFNTMGERIALLIREDQSAGFHQVRWNGKNDAGLSVSSGDYLYRLTCNGTESRTGKLTLIK